MWFRRRLLDAVRLGAWPRTTLVLQPSGRGTSFVRAAADASFWPADAKVRIGRSVSKNLHRIALLAVAEICARRTNEPLRKYAPQEHRAAELETAGHLADWLLACVSDGLLKESQASYLFTSGAHRARAISTMLQTVGKTDIARIVDVGTGVGLIPWLLCAESDQVQSVELFEPANYGRAALKQLWSSGRCADIYSVAHVGAQDVPFSNAADVIMFCHCLLHIDRRHAGDVLRRAWQALSPGGVLLVNETPKEAGTDDRLRDSLLTRDEIVEMMPAAPQLFISRTGWRKGHDPRAITARAIGSSGLFVAVKA